MHRHLIVRTALVCGLAGAAWCAWSSLDPSAARADDRPAAVTEQAGGLLGTVRDVVDQVVPEPTTAAEPEPTKEPEPEREPEHGEEPASEPASEQEPANEDPPADPIGDIVEVITTPPPVVVTAPPVVVTPPAPPVLTPTPAPLPTTPEPAQAAAGETLDTDESPDTEGQPAPEQAGPGVEPTDLPVVIGPVLGRAVGAGIHLTDPDRVVTPAPAPVCDGRDDSPSGTPPAGKPDRRGDRPDSAADTTRTSGPCPGAPTGPAEQITGMAAVPCPGTQGSDHMLAVTSAVGLPCPALERLYEVRPRSWIPASRSTHLDPRPA